jgi:hypothetical protein
MSYQKRFKPMKGWIPVWILLLIVGSSAIASAKGPEINFVDQKLSINVETIPLGRLLQLVDLATGMKSKVPTDLANRNISVKFSGLSVTDAVRKIFQGQPLDYVVIEGQSIVVTAAAQTLSAGGDATPLYNNNSQPNQAFEQQPQPFFQESPILPQQIPQQFPPQQQNQPAMVQTPFGPIPNPRAQQPNVGIGNPVQQQPQQNSLFPQTGLPTSQPQPGFPPPPGNQPGNLTPFGAPSPFGTTNPPATNQNNNLFGNPTILTPGAPQR